MTRLPRALVSGLALGSLLLPVAVASASETTDGPVVVVEAADDPGTRVAASFPAGWRLEAPTEAAPRREVHALAIDERCELSTRRSEFADPATDMDDFVISLGPGSGFILLERAAVELPAGPAERIDFAADEGGRWSAWIVPDGGYMHELWCRGDELPDGRWREIAETIDIAPATTLGSSPFDATAALPTVAAAIDFPEDWQVRGSSVRLGLLYATSDDAVCSLSDYSSLAPENGWAAVDDMHDEYVAVADDRDNLSVEEAGYVDLMAGRTGLADITFEDGTRAIRYSFADPSGQTLLALFCVGDPTPEDRYLSLAESLEWLAR